MGEHCLINPIVGFSLSSNLSSAGESLPTEKYRMNEKDIIPFLKDSKQPRYLRPRSNKYMNTLFFYPRQRASKETTVVRKMDAYDFVVIGWMDVIKEKDVVVVRKPRQKNIICTLE